MQGMMTRDAGSASRLLVRETVVRPFLFLAVEIHGVTMFMSSSKEFCIRRHCLLNVAALAPVMSQLSPTGFGGLALSYVTVTAFQNACMGTLKFVPTTPQPPAAFVSTTRT